MRNKRKTTYMCITLCGLLVLAGCKSENRQQQQAVQQNQGEQIEQNIQPPDAEPYLLLDDYHTRKFDHLGKLTELMDGSPAAADPGYSQLFIDATYKVMECGSGLDKTLLCMSMLRARAENDWQLQYDRYSGYLDLVDGLYKFEFYIAEEEQPEPTETEITTQTTSTPGYIAPADPLATADEPTLSPTTIPERLAGYIEGTLPEGTNRMAINVYTGRIEDGSRALTLWFEFMRDEQGGYWTQSYYAYDDVGVQFSTVREHITAEGISYAILHTTERPGSIFSQQTNEATFFDEAFSIMRFDGTSAVYTEDGEVVAEF